jgi:phosphatidylserine/phosphatidylglycerophosphate/cardiolipin synthase-like enzyme
LDKARTDFAEHHYTILESIYLMSHIQKLEELNTVKSFADYTRVLNNLMLYQTYAGRIRDNIRDCFLALNLPEQANDACSRLEEFYSHRHAFVHGKKLPFRIDDANIFHIAKPKSKSTDTSGAGKGFLWSEITIEEMKAADEYLEESIIELKAIMNNLLEVLLQNVKQIIEQNKLVLFDPPVQDKIIKTTLSGSNITVIYTENNSSAGYIPPASGTIDFNR